MFCVLDKIIVGYYSGYKDKDTDPKSIEDIFVRELIDI